MSPISYARHQFPTVVAPTGPATRTEDAAFQISRIRSALRLDAFRRLQHLQSSASSDLPPHAAPVPGGGYSALASRGYVTGTVVAPLHAGPSSRDKALEAYLAPSVARST